MKKNFKWILSLLVAVFAVSIIGNTAFADGNYDNIADGQYKIDVRALENGTDNESAANDFIHDPTLTIQEGNPTLTLGIGAGGGDFSDFDFSIEWVQVEGKDPIEESDNGDLTYYTFQLDNLDTLVPAAMEYVVPDFPPFKDGHEVSFDLELSGLDNLPEKGADNPEGNENDDNEGGENEGDNGHEEEADNGAVDDNGDNDTTENGTEENGDNVENDNGTVEENGDNEENSNGAVGDNGNNGNGTTDGEEVTNPQTGDSTNIWYYVVLLIGSILVPAGILFKRRFAHQ